MPLEYSEGDSYIIAESVVGEWQGQDLKIASMQDGVWAFFTPKIGRCCYDQSSEALLTWSGSVWQPHGLTWNTAFSSQATGSQVLQISYDCGAKVSAWSVNGSQVFEVNGDVITPYVLLKSDEMVCGQYLYSKPRVFIASNTVSGEDGPASDPTLATNLDHIWNNDSTNEWHFCSDTTYKAIGNATLRAAAFTTSSDYRLKNDISSLDRDNFVKRIMTINPVTFKWRSA